LPRKVNLFSPDVRELEEKNLRFFSSSSRTSGEKRFIKNPVLLDLNEMEGEKSKIFLLPFHLNQVKQDFILLQENSEWLIMRHWLAFRSA